MENKNEIKTSWWKPAFGKRRASMFEIIGEFFLVLVFIISTLEAESFGVLIFFISLALALFIKGIRDVRFRINTTT